MRAVLLLAGLVLAGMSFAGQEPKKKTYFAWLVRGETKAPADKTELQKMQAAHIGNFQVQFNKGNLIGAGPVQDPRESRRGIVILTVDSAAKIPGLFVDDPYVHSGIMKVDAAEWSLGSSKIGTELPDPNAIEENRIVVITALNKSLTKEQTNELEAATKPLGTTGVGGWVGPKGLKMVFLMQGPERESLDRQLSEVGKHLEDAIHIEIFPLWMAKGALPVRK